MADSSGLPEPNYGCGLTDFGCLIDESIARVMTGLIGGLGNFIADMITNSFKDSTLNATTWSAATEEFWFWASIMASVVMVVLVWQVSVAALLRDHRRMAKAAIGGVLAIPFASWSVQMMRKAVTMADLFAVDAVQRTQGGTLSTGLLRLLGIGVKAGDPGAVDRPGDLGAFFEKNSAVSALISAHNSSGQVIIAVCLVGIMAIASMVLYVLMEVRNMGLLALAALAPIALVFIGQATLMPWAKKWAGLAVGLMMAKPLAAGVIALLVNVTTTTTSLGTLLVVSAGVLVAAFSPFWAVGLVAFTGSEVGHAMARRGSATQQVNKAQTFTRFIPRKK